ALWTTSFPAPQDIYINMMPVRCEDLRGTMPRECAGYADMLATLIGQRNGIAYLTIDERRVPVGKSHRRPGLHIDSPVVREGDPLARLGSNDTGRPFTPFFVRWGRGMVDTGSHTRLGGIYFASTVPNSSRVYPNVILNASIVGKDGQLGDIHHILGTPTTLEPQRIYWMTDKTPHESLPLDSELDDGSGTVYRQFVRLVAGPIDVWYSKHNTPSPVGVMPECPIVDIDKFAA
ncbi:hypothetical protein HDU93_000893, partial [Gonapodya sp. JEL0774]